MPKRKWNRLHDEATIADERHHRSQQLSEQRDARATIEAAVAELQEAPEIAGRARAPRPAGPGGDDAKTIKDEPEDPRDR